MKTIAEILKEGRIRKGLTQYEVAQYLGFKSMDRISRWEHATAEPSARNFIRLVGLYDLSMEQVLSLISPRN